MLTTIIGIATATTAGAVAPIPPAQVAERITVEDDPEAVFERFAREGFDKSRVRQTLFEHARIPFADIGQSNADVLSVLRGPCIDEADGQRTLRIVEKPEDILIVVVGGAGNHSASIPGWYSRSVTLPIVSTAGTPA